MAATPLAIAEYGDAAIMVTAQGGAERDRRLRIREFRERMLADLPPGVEDVVSGLESLLVEFDPLRTTSEQVAYVLGVLSRAAPDRSGERSPGRRLVVPMVVTPETAPDLHEVAAEQGMAPDVVIERVESSELTVSLLAAAMAPMMDGLDLPVPVRRRSTPRTDVPAGAVMIAGRNVIIQPFSGPSGWRVIGRTPLRIVDIARTEPVSFRPGDVMAFGRIDEEVAASQADRFLEVEP